MRGLIYILLCFLPFGLFGQETSEWKTQTPVVDVEVSIAIYPNPTVNFVTIKGDAIIEEGKYVLTNMIGKQLEVGLFNGQAITLSMEEHAKGIYMLTIFDSKGKKVTTRKILKE